MHRLDIINGRFAKALWRDGWHIAASAKMCDADPVPTRRALSLPRRWPPRCLQALRVGRNFQDRARAALEKHQQQAKCLNCG